MTFWWGIKLLCVRYDAGIEQEELERQRVEAQRRLEERSGELDAKEKEALLEKFKRDEVQCSCRP